MRSTRTVAITLCIAMQLFTRPALASDPFAELEASTKPAAAAKENYKNTPTEFEQFRQHQLALYDQHKQKLNAEFSQYKQIAQEERRKYHHQLKQFWADPELSSKKIWVAYSDDLKKKTRVDFENKQITLSVMADNKAQASEQAIRQAVKQLLTKNRAQAFQDDKVAQAIERRAKTKLTNLVTAKVEAAPILIPYLTGKPQASETEVDQMVDQIMTGKKVSTQKHSNGKSLVTVQLPLDLPAEQPPTMATGTAPTSTAQIQSLPNSAQNFYPAVSKNAQKSQLDTSLVFAIIETESAFNPMAKSSVPAYGLMQIVPRSAGQDATQQIFGEPKILSPSYLYNSDNNIEIGTTYLNILYYRYLKGIKDPTSRLYCTIAAYNTGAGNVAKAFTGKRQVSTALTQINRMTPPQVYQHLRLNLPYEETRHYLKKVNSRVKKYEL